LYVCDALKNIIVKSLTFGAKKRLELHLNRKITYVEEKYTMLDMPLSMMEYRAFFVSCLLTREIKNRQSLSKRSLSWRKHLVEGKENWLMVWLIGEMTGRIRAGRSGELRWSFFRESDSIMDFHGAMDCFQVIVNRSGWPDVGNHTYRKWKRECIAMGLLMPLRQKSNRCFVNPNFFADEISPRKKMFLVSSLYKNLAYLPIQGELLGILMKNQIYKGVPFPKDLLEYVSMGEKPVMEYYTKNSLCRQYLFPKKGVSLPISNLMVSYNAMFRKV